MVDYTKIEKRTPGLSGSANNSLVVPAPLPGNVKKERQIILWDVEPDSAKERQTAL